MLQYQARISNKEWRTDCTHNCYSETLYTGTVVLFNFDVNLKIRLTPGGDWQHCCITQPHPFSWRLTSLTFRLDNLQWPSCWDPHPYRGTERYPHRCSSAGHSLWGTGSPVKRQHSQIYRYPFGHYHSSNTLMLYAKGKTSDFRILCYPKTLVLLILPLFFYKKSLFHTCVVVCIVYMNVVWKKSENCNDKMVD